MGAQDAPEPTMRMAADDEADPRGCAPAVHDVPSPLRLGAAALPKTPQGAYANQITSVSTRTSLGDTEDANQARAKFAKYFAFCFFSCAGISALAILLWSSMGCGRDCLRFLEECGDYVMYTAGFSFVAFLVLYLLDFFIPPHIPGKHLVLYDGDRYLGKSLVVLVVLAFFASCLFSSRDFPSMPILITTFLIPASVAGVRLALNPPQAKSKKEAAASRTQGFQERMELLRLLTGKERDQTIFYAAALSAFFSTSAGCLAAWCLWVALDVEHFERLQEAGQDPGELEVLYILWAAPMVVSLSNFVFGLIVSLRVYMGRTYGATDTRKSELTDQEEESSGSSSAMNKELMKHRLAMFDEAVKKKGYDESHEKAQAIEARREEKKKEYLKQHMMHMRQLSNIVKVVGCALLFMFGALFVTAQLVAADSHIALTAQGWLACVFVAFVSFVGASFRRLWRTMRAWLRDLPLWRSALSLLNSDWTRAFCIMLLLPTAPFVVFLSVINQTIRKARKLPLDMSQNSSGSSGTSMSLSPSRSGTSNLSSRSPTSSVSRSPTSSLSRQLGLYVNVSGTGLLTQRVERQWMIMAGWDRLSVLRKIYVISWGSLMVMVTQLVLPVFLSWMRTFTQEYDLSFFVICAFTFVVGLCCFLLPPVPGAPVYFFAGIIVTESCMRLTGSDFWVGTAIAITLSWLLKLTACAMQQKLIGERLGHSSWVQRTTGVHKPFIRTVEAVLRKPGISTGKVMILCGGPDWPTSVLAGILKLSLFQMELGTTPIIVYVTPLTMAGSFYLRRSDGEFWVRGSNLMFTATLLVTVVLYVGMAWAMQNEFDRNSHALSRPMEQYLDLDWRDYCQARVKHRCAITWDDVPALIRFAYLSGAVVMIAVLHVFWWMAAGCFNSFGLEEPIGDFRLYGPEGALVKPLGLLGLAAAALTLLCLWPFQLWLRVRTRKPREQELATLAEDEARWKKERIADAHRALGSGSTGVSCGSKSDSQQPSGGPRPPTSPKFSDSAAPPSSGQHDERDAKQTISAWEGTRKGPAAGPQTTLIKFPSVASDSARSAGAMSVETVVPSDEATRGASRTAGWECVPNDEDGRSVPRILFTRSATDGGSPRVPRIYQC